MKTISVSILPEDYEAFRLAAKSQHRSIAQLIREAMTFYRSERLEKDPPLTSLPTLVGHRPVKPLPSRAEIHEEIFS
jgi:hypothetical protein